MLKRITKREAKKLFAEGDKVIILSPCKFYPSGPFSMGCRIAGREYLQHKPETAWERMYANWAFYNTGYETGYYAHYYVETTNEKGKE